MFKFFTTAGNYQWLNSLLIAVSAALLCKETFIVTGLDYKGYAVYALVFLSTLYAYINYPGEKNFSAIQFNAFKNFKETIGNPFFDSIAGFLILNIIFVHSVQSFFIISAVALISIFYFGIEVPGTNFNIRKIYFAKTILLALVWSIATVLLPVSFTGEALFSSKVLFVFARRFFFISALTIPFEIRDQQKDAACGDKSFVNLIGIKKSKTLALFLLIIFVTLAFIEYKDAVISLNLTIAMLLSFLLSATLIMIYDAGKKNGNLILFCIDGMLITQFFFILAATLLRA